MLTTFFSAIGGKLSDRLAAISAPALIFWLGGLLAWSCAHGGSHALARPATWLSRQATFAQVVIVAVVLVGIAASAVLVSLLTTPALRLLEGYWPGWASPLRRRLIQRVILRGADADEQWQQVAGQLFEANAGADTEAGADLDKTASAKRVAMRAELLAKYGRLERARDRRPSRPVHYLPTKTGNILRAAETRPRDRYGLDAVAVWPRLWLVLPDSTKQEISGARTALNSAVAASIWGILFLVFIPWTILALPIGLAVCAAAVLVWVPARAWVFCQLVVAAFDVHRTLLYQQLRWPLPVTPYDEQLRGKEVSSYLQKGSDDTAPTFTPPR
ncbi:MAG: hypothetical protein ABSA02_27130 [Trebonia sp.]